MIEAALRSRAHVLLAGMLAGMLACTSTTPSDDAGDDAPILDEDQTLPPLVPRPATITCTMTGTPATALPRLEPEWAGTASFPDAIQILPDPFGGTGLLVVESSGRAWRVDAGGTAQSEPWLDLAGIDASLRALAVGEGWVFAYLQPLAQPGLARVVRLPFDPAQPDVALASDAMLTMLELDDGGRGGALARDATGHLLIGVGDVEGSRAQDPAALQGKLLRIAAPSEALPGYAIPPDNPFASSPSGAPEVYALGLHDPRVLVQAGATTFASERGLLRGEIDRVVAGANFGWPLVDGWQCSGPGDCDPTSFRGPTFDVALGDEHCEPRLGALVEGSTIPGLAGALVWSDRCSGRLWGLAPQGDDASEVPRAEVLGAVDAGVLALGLDASGEPWLITGEGQLARLVVAEHGEPGSLPQRLSETGCFEADLRTPKPELVPYLLSAPLWSDGLHKRRYFVVPPGEQIGIDVLGRWRFPSGSVLIKTFSLDVDHPIETRVMVRRDGTWDFYTYRWRDDGSDADLLSDAATRMLEQSGEAFAWEFPSETGCRSCHGFGEGELLGPGTAQLNREVVYGEQPREQLDALVELGLFMKSPGSASELPRIVDPRDQDAPLEQRARAYLHGNCAHCHQPAWMDPDLRWDTPLDAMAACNHPTEYPSDAGGELRIAPGEPEHSNLWLRMTTRGDDRMPPLGSGRGDEFGHALVEAWIASLVSCE